ncbi:hypothetical protein M5K25_006874 [Dendrobium thyrsiflorum]|uniref:Uncharacterized protein n=1 Tax=Dendrobium thyrsiflorum TaxID=117978 RepID=A0ABD0VCA0_DENTH
MVHLYLTPRSFYLTLRLLGLPPFAELRGCKMERHKVLLLYFSGPMAPALASGFALNAVWVSDGDLLHSGFYFMSVVDDIVLGSFGKKKTVLVSKDHVLCLHQEGEKGFQMQKSGHMKNNCPNLKIPPIEEKDKNKPIIKMSNDKKQKNSWADLTSKSSDQELDNEYFIFK